MIGDITPTSRAFAEAARARQRSLVKPPGSLGRLEEVAIAIAAASPDGRARSRPAAALVFASDHPVAANGVSAYPPEVTAAMVAGFASGGAAAAVACRRLGVSLEVVDVGVRGRDAAPEVVHGEGARIVRDPAAAMPAGDLSREDAMPDGTLAAAVFAGARAVERLPQDTRLVILGEMGIGNTTAAAAVCGAILGLPARAIVGPGTGVDGARLANKQRVVTRALTRVQASATPLEVLGAVGGRDLAAIFGAAREAARRGMVVLVDGFVVTAALLAVARAYPEARARMVFAHRSAEPGHARALAALEAAPLLDLGMRLGEASGALAALPLVDLACAWHEEMATFDEAHVPGPAT